MTREELISDINSILEENENLSTVVYAVLKETYEVKQLDIVEDEIKNIQKIFIDSIKKNIIDKEELILQKFSEADDRKSDIFEYDLELPKELCFFNAELNDTISIFKFNNDKIINIESLIIEIGTEEKQLRLFKKITPVEILGRGGIVLWLKSNQRFESFNEQVLRFTDSFYALTFDSLTYENKAEVMDFIKARVDKMMGSTPKDIKEAVLASSNFVVADMLEAASALVEASKEEDFKPSVESLSRAFNLAEKVEGVATVDSALFENDQEKALAEAVESLILSGSASQQLKQLFALSPVIDAFFENTMVMAEDQAVRQNRLAILSHLTQKAAKLARFNQINTK